MCHVFAMWFGEIRPTDGVSHLHLYYSIHLSTRVFLVNCSYPAPAAGMTAVLFDKVP